MSESLFDQIGGEAAVDAAVDIFYRKVLADHTINRFFDSTDMEAQAAKQKAFLTMAFGGPNNYSGTDMRKAHEKFVKMGLDDNHLDAVAGHFLGTLKELDVPQDLIDQVGVIAESTRDDVLNR